MKKMVYLLLVLGLFIVGFSQIGMAFNGPQRNNRAWTMFNNSRYANNPLDLNEEQQQNLNEIREQFFTERDEITNQLREENGKLRDLNFSDDEEIAVVKEKINSLQNKLFDLRLNYYDKLKNILSAEQLEKMAEFHNYRSNNMYRGKGSNKMRRNLCF